ncbi:MAG: hypothetical protein AAFQ43_02180 [Bacteroidota bacterium]
MHRLCIALALVLGACSSEDAPPPADLGATSDAEQADLAPDSALTDAAPDTVPSAPVADASGETADPDLPETPEAGADEGPAVITFVNDTGMSIEALHMVGCTETEGNDIETMREWTYNYIDAPIAPGASADVEIGADCLLTLPVWEDGTEVMEKVLVEGDMTHSIVLG